MIRVLFVCLGNICRSPTAEGVLQKKVNDMRLSDNFQIDSAGTAGWHTGSAPDSRTILAAKARGIDLSGLRARQFTKKDFEHFDYIFAMDESNLADMKKIMPAEFSGHLGLFLDYSDQTKYRSVPDPYHGDPEDFERVLDLVDSAAYGFLKTLHPFHAPVK